MPALVTGANGFLGLYLVEQLLARGTAVRALVRRPSPQLQQLGVEVVLADLTDKPAVVAACEGCDTVYHAGAVAGIWGSWQTYFGTNYQGTQHVLAGCLAHSVPRLVFTSSPSVTFDGRDQCDVDESAPYPKSWLAYYPQTKAMAEQEVLAANGTPHSRGQLLTCALRPHLIWGPRDSHLIPRLLDRARSGRLRQVGKGQNLIDISYVENVAVAHLQAADALKPGSPACGRAYFLSQGEPVNCWGWINDVLQLAGLPRLTKRISATAAYAIGASLEGVYSVAGLTAEPPMTRFLAKQLSTHHYFDLTRARADFGYAPAISTAEGMQRLAASWGSAAKGNS